MQWCDIGVNLTDKRLTFEPVFFRALDAGISQMLITGTSITTSEKALELATQHPQNLFCTAGVHPHHASEYDPQSSVQIAQLAKSKQVAAIGECGLDFNRNFSTPAEQLSAFEQQLELACELQLPVFLHERDAFEQQLTLLKKYQARLTGGVVHCFTGNTKQIQEYLALGLYIGVTGWVCDPKRGEDLRAAVKTLPIDKLLLETDAPYLRPKGLTNNRKLDKGNNEPAYLPYIAQQIAALIECELSILNQAVTNNTQALFGIAVGSNG